MKLAIGADHAGFPLKGPVIELLEAKGHSVADFGTYSLDPVDFPDIAGKVCAALRSGDAERGILVCGTGVGAAIAANKHPGIRAPSATTTLRPPVRGTRRRQSACHRGVDRRRQGRGRADRRLSARGVQHRSGLPTPVFRSCMTSRCGPRTKFLPNRRANGSLRCTHVACVR